MTDTPETVDRQTLSWIRDLLRSHGLRPKAKMGQNFLIDLNLLDLIVNSAELTPADSILEVGTGTGGLTGKLAAAAGSVVSVELDTDFHRMAKQVLPNRPNLRLLHGDILERKNELNPGVIDVWNEMTAAHGCTVRKLVANLPYVVATPVIANLLVSDIPVERMVVMIQWEMAERLVAVPGTKDYGSLSILVQSVADVSIVRKIPPTVFWPRPAVDSAIVKIVANPEKRREVGDVMQFRIFLRNLYVHKRKNLRQALSGWPDGRREKADVDATLERLGIDGSLRAETLDLTTHRRLCQAFAAPTA